MSLCGVSEVATAVIIDFETLQVRPQLRSVASVGYGLTDYGPGLRDNLVIMFLVFYRFKIALL